MTFSSGGRLARTLSTRERTQTSRDVPSSVRSVFRYFPPEVRTNAREWTRTLIRAPAINERARDRSHVRSKQIFESATRRARASSGVNKGSARKKVLGGSNTCGWFRAARANVTHFVWASGTLVWRAVLVCSCLLKTTLTTPAIYLRRVPFALTFFRPVDETSRETVILVFTG